MFAEKPGKMSMKNIITKTEIKKKIKVTNWSVNKKINTIWEH